MAGARSAGNSLPSQEVLDDLCSRFILNAPAEELQSFERILFLVEQAHWFYEDNAMEQNRSLKSLSLRDFAALNYYDFLNGKVFQSCSALRPYIDDLDDIYKDFTSYKVRVPVTGAIILDESYEKCVLVKGWKAGASWSFPRGKKNKDEEDQTCAVREVWEETGFDIAALLKVDEHIETVIGQQRVRLFIIGGVSSDTVFTPQTKKEISEVAWHKVDELPTNSNETYHRGPSGLKYYMVSPFVGPLKVWISGHKSTAHRENSLKGASVWKVKPSAPPITTSSGIIPIIATSAENLHIIPPSASESSSRHSSLDSLDELPGKSFRNFRFDMALILKKLELE